MRAGTGAAAVLGVARFRVRRREDLGQRRWNKPPPRKTAGVSLTEHGIQPDQAADEVVKIHVPSFIRVASDDHVVEMFIQMEP